MRHLLITILFTTLLAAGSSTTFAAKEGESVSAKINFLQLQPDWWTNWDYLDQSQKQEFIKSAQSNFNNFLEEAPQDLAWTSIKPDVDSQTGAILALCAKPLDVEKLEMPEKNVITILQWASLYEQSRKLETIAKAQARETENHFQSANESLETLRSAVIVYRNEKDIILKNQQGAKTFLLQLSHLEALEQLNRSKTKLERIQNNIQTLKSKLDSFLGKIIHSNDVLRTLQNQRKRLELEIDKLRAEEEKISQRRQKISDRTSKASQLRIELQALANKASTILTEAKINETSILIDINFVLDNPASKLETTWAEQLEARAAEAQAVNDQGDFIRLQLLSAAYQEERSKSYQALWQQFEELQRVNFDIRTTIEYSNEYRRVLSKIYVKERGWLALVSNWWNQWWEDFDLSLGDIFNYPLFIINESPITILNLVNIVLIITLAIFVSFSIRRGLTGLGDKYEVSESTTFTIGRVLHYTVVTAAIIFALASLGLDFSKIALVAGALSVGIGFGLQSIFNNFVSGLILLFERPLKVGDIVELESGVMGHIRAINVRSTRVTTRDNIDILVPNSEFINGRVTNYTFADPMRRIHIPFKVAQGSDKSVVRSAGLAAANKIRYTGTSKGKKPDVWLVEFSDSWLTFALVVWVNSHRSPNDNYLMALYNWELDNALRDFGIKTPIPRREIAFEPEPYQGFDKNNLANKIAKQRNRRPR